jgi:pimeloyl-ACP methyl ester carboxylesterase
MRFRSELRWSVATVIGIAGFVASPALAAKTLSAVKAPVRVVRVSWGRIGYRSIGQGRPLVLVVGSTASIDDWAPTFLDHLARHHRVLVFDNEGVGRTTLRPGTLTISRMADDTAAFIAAMHLKRPDVLGWSMGGFIVQALAVRHPTVVRRMILCATSAGDGSSRPPSGLKTSPPFANLFPADQDAARRAFIRDIHRYRGFYQAPATVKRLQVEASRGWGQGAEPSGHLLATVRAPTLIGDGSADPFDPVANSRALKADIRNAQLHIYPDAAHGFWYQDANDWIRRIDRFLQ